MDITNPIYFEFVNLGLIRPDRIKLISHNTRDKNIPVFIDTESGIIFLGKLETSNDYYEIDKPEDMEGEFSIVGLEDGSIIKTRAIQDDVRRVEQFGDYITNRSICDFGSGYGGFLSLVKKVAKSYSGVELRQHCHDYIARTDSSIVYRKSIDDFKEQFDLVTMFHVLEHIPYQVKVLSKIRDKLNKNGTLVVEVPNAKDFLIQSVDIPEFRYFTFWSEHLVLHTKESLEAVVKESGFNNVAIIPYQRYGYTNHLRWFLEKKPGGHDAYKKFEDKELDIAYRKSREKDWSSDTLIAIATI